MDTNDLLGSLLSDPTMLQSAISTAASLLGGGDAPPPTDAQSTNNSTYDPTADVMARFMPVLGRITQSGQQSINREKRALLNAVKPFVSPTLSAQIDHGMRLVMLAQMARAAIHPSEEERHV